MEYAFVANVTSTAANDSTNNWQWHNYDENFAQYYVVVPKIITVPFAPIQWNFWRYCEANGDTDRMMTLTMFLVRSMDILL